MLATSVWPVLSGVQVAAAPGSGDLPRAAIPVCGARETALGSAGAARLSRLPVAFVENRGQWDTPARFVARRGGLVARLEPDAIVLQIEERDEEGTRGAVVRLAFENASPRARLEGEERRPGIYNFFLGNDPAKWRTEVPAYGSALVRGLQEGVDLRLREERGSFEYDLVLAPGADLDRVVVRCEGIERLEVGPDGTLAMGTALGPIRQPPPRTWTARPGGERRPVEARFRVLGPDRFGFEAPGRDPSLELVIDPGLVYSTFLGGSSDDFALAIALDAAGAATVAGNTFSLAFPTTAGAYDTTFGAGMRDAFVARLSPSGSALVYSTYLGGSADDLAMGLALDAAGAATVAGTTSAANFPATAGAYDTSFGGFQDGFVARLSPSGSALRYSTFLGGFAADEALRVALDATGAATVAGVTASPDFPTTPGAYDTTYNGASPFPPGGFGDAFVSRLGLLPAGASVFGGSTPGCGGPLAAGVTSIPQVGNASFAITCTNGPPNLPPGPGLGVLAFSLSAFDPPLVAFGVSIWIDLNLPPFYLALASTDALGAAEVLVPVPPSPLLAGGSAFAQFFWPDPCAPGGISASNALAIVVQS